MHNRKRRQRRRHFHWILGRRPGDPDTVHILMVRRMYRRYPGATNRGDYLYLKRKLQGETGR